MKLKIWNCNTYNQLCIHLSLDLVDRCVDFATFLAQENVTSEVFKNLRQSESTGRPLGSADWINKLTAMTGRELKAKKRGPKSKVKGGN